MRLEWGSGRLEGGCCRRSEGLVVVRVSRHGISLAGRLRDDDWICSGVSGESKS